MSQRNWTYTDHESNLVMRHRSADLSSLPPQGVVVVHVLDLEERVPRPLRAIGEEQKGVRGQDTSPPCPPPADTDSVMRSVGTRRLPQSLPSIIPTDQVPVHITHTTKQGKTRRI